MKPTKRYEFKFQRSFFDVLNEIPEDADKLQFLLAIINKQFLDEDPKDLGFAAKISYEGQRHFIEKSVKGYKDRMKTDLLGNPIHPHGGSKEEVKHPHGGSGEKTEHPHGQEQEQEKEQEKEQLLKGNPEKIVKINNKDFSNSCLMDSQWFEVISMQNRIKPDVTKIYLQHFLEHLITMQEQKTNVKEFKTHFTHWLNKQDLSQHTTRVIGKTNQV